MTPTIDQSAVAGLPAVRHQRLSMQIQRSEDSREASMLETLPRGGWARLKLTVAKRWAKAANVIEDIVILGQFAFGREYINRPVA